jgi:putative heme-binding domain-containing protein
LLRREPWARALVDYLAEEGIPLTTLDPTHIARLVNYPADEVSRLARSLHGQHISADRQQVFKEYQQASTGGDPSRGKLVFEKNCATCHELGATGNAVGPNLAAMANRGPESLLFNVLVPNGEVDPRYLEYVILTVDGQVASGIIGGETSTAVTLRGPDNKTTTILRVDIDDMHSSGKSLMPEGFERIIDKPAMADLLAYLLQAASPKGPSP